MHDKPLPKKKYTPEELSRAYREWAAIEPSLTKERTDAWDRYCDARDGLKPGISAKKRILGDTFLVRAALGLHDD